MLPFQAMADVHWRHPLAQAAEPAARQLLANCHLGSIRVQPAFGHVALLQAVHHHMQTGTAMLRQVSRCSYQTQCSRFASLALISCGAYLQPFTVMQYHALLNVYMGMHSLPSQRVCCRNSRKAAR